MTKVQQLCHFTFLSKKNAFSVHLIKKGQFLFVCFLLNSLMCCQALSQGESSLFSPPPRFPQPLLLNTPDTVLETGCITPDFCLKFELTNHSLKH